MRPAVPAGTVYSGTVKVGQRRPRGRRRDRRGRVAWMYWVILVVAVAVSTFALWRIQQVDQQGARGWPMVVPTAAVPGRGVHTIPNPQEAARAR